MINGFILVSVLCLKGASQGSLVAGVPSEKVNCQASINEVYKTRLECEKKNEKLTEIIEIDRGSSVKKMVVMPGSACVEINRIVGSTIDWKVE